MKRISCFSVLRLWARYAKRRTGQARVKTQEREKFGMERHISFATNDTVKQGFKI